MFFTKVAARNIYNHAERGWGTKQVSSFFSYESRIYSYLQQKRAKDWGRGQRLDRRLQQWKSQTEVSRQIDWSWKEER